MGKGSGSVEGNTHGEDGEGYASERGREAGELETDVLGVDGETLTMDDL